MLLLCSICLQGPHGSAMSRLYGLEPLTKACSTYYENQPNQKNNNLDPTSLAVCLYVNYNLFGLAVLNVPMTCTHDLCLLCPLVQHQHLSFICLFFFPFMTIQFKYSDPFPQSISEIAHFPLTSDCMCVCVCL